MGTGPQEAESALFAAIAAGNLDTVKEEISRDGALLHQAEGGFEQTPLHRAVSAKQLAVTQFLLENGADPNALDVFNQTPLAVAMDVEAGNEMIQLLKDYGADD
jgi:ankyrin repeat protein